MDSAPSRLDPERFRAGARDANQYFTILIFVASAVIALLVFGSAAAVAQGISYGVVFAVDAAVVVAGFSAMRWFDNALARRARNAWAEAANTCDLVTGIDSVEAVPTMHGTIDGRKLDIRLTAEQNYAAGKELVRTVFDVQLEERLAPLELAFRDTVYFRESEGVALDKQGDIRVYGIDGDPGSDHLNNSALRNQLAEAATQFGTLHIVNGSIDADWTGAPRRADDLIEAIDTLVDLADHLEETFASA